MKNKIFIAFELLKFDENDIKQWSRLKLLIHTIEVALVYIYIYMYKELNTKFDFVLAEAFFLHV